MCAAFQRAGVQEVKHHFDTVAALRNVFPVASILLQLYHGTHMTVSNAIFLKIIFFVCNKYTHELEY